MQRPGGRPRVWCRHATQRTGAVEGSRCGRQPPPQACREFTSRLDCHRPIDAGSDRFGSDCHGRALRSTAPRSGVGVHRRQRTDHRSSNSRNRRRRHYPSGGGQHPRRCAGAPLALGRPRRRQRVELRIETLRVLRWSRGRPRVSGSQSGKTIGVASKA